MQEAEPRTVMIEQLVAAARSDARIIGMLDYGSSSEGRGDEWSDVDVAVFVRDMDIDEFTASWEPWAAQFGDLLLAYIGHIGHPWAVYNTGSIPLRVDFDLLRQSDISSLPTWPNNPGSVEEMLWYDGTGGALRDEVASIVGQSLAPANPEAEFTRLAGDFHYFLLYCHAKLQRGEVWVARQAFHREVLEPLLRLVRLEAGATERWRGSQGGHRIETTANRQRLDQLDECVPDVAPESLHVAIHRAARLGQDVCSVIADRNGWTWPATLADRLNDLLDAGTNFSSLHLHRPS